MKPWLILGWWCVVALAAPARAQVNLPVYIEDSHSGSFHWLAEHLDLEESCMLLHFDAHSDASAVFDSDKIRAQLRDVTSTEERRLRLEDWRRDGTIQCFDWIEPLMPAPIAQVIWISREFNSPETRARGEAEATRQLDGHLEAAPRSAGAFAGRYRTMSLSDLLAANAIDGPLVATIDLDYFAELSVAERETQFARIWKFLIERPNLRAITIAISRPYLADDAEADALLELALRKALLLPTAQIQFEPFRVVGNDQSLRAREYRAQHRPVPAFDVEKSSRELRALFLANQKRIAVRGDAARWQSLLGRWRASVPAFHLAVKGHEPSTDSVWRVPVDEAARLEAVAEPWDAHFENVKWIVQVPQYSRCNLTLDGNDRAVFARGAPPRPVWREVALSSSDKTLSFSELAAFFDPASGCGAVRIRARIESDQWLRETPAIEIRRGKGTGFRAALSEQFGLPYLFGSGALRDGSDTGPETGWGADCANFLTYALRRQGLRIPWSNPRQFRRYLEPVAERLGAEEQPRFTEEELERGVILHLGSHVAALVEDKPLLGVLNAEDLVAHQLEGVPAMISVGELLRSRHVTSFDLLRVPAMPGRGDLILGGDVMLGRGVGEQITRGADVFAGISEILRSAKCRVVNLEWVISDRGEPISGRKFTLRAPIAAAKALRDAGISYVGLANNHVNDFGAAARLDAIEHLREAGVGVIGAGDHTSVIVLENGWRVALLAIDATAALDRSRLEGELLAVQARADSVITLAHWGEENTPHVTEEQRELARWLVDHGVDLVVGSHPHCLQPVDYYHGRAIVYSLGNLVFDGAPTLPEWNRGALLEVSWHGLKKSPSLNLVPVRLDACGFPRLEGVHALTKR